MGIFNIVYDDFAKLLSMTCYHDTIRCYVFFWALDTILVVSEDGKSSST